MKTIALLVLVALGCSASEVESVDAGREMLGADGGAPDASARYMCGQSAGKMFVARLTNTRGTCAPSVDLDITIGDLNDYCAAIGQVRTDGAFGSGICDIACYGGTTPSCSFFAAVACQDGCQGSYAIQFTAK